MPVLESSHTSKRVVSAHAVRLLGPPTNKDVSFLHRFLATTAPLWLVVQL
ncbi:MAG: hypothetical protein OXI46_04430 [Gemmatimonadota bacterium]|nr:hypothetical protein [Gemmatimonadota bacterium]